MTDACGRPDGKNPKQLLERYEVRYALRGMGTIRVAGWDADPEAENTIKEITDDWVTLWVLDTDVTPSRVIKERNR